MLHPSGFEGWPAIAVGPKIPVDDKSEPASHFNVAVCLNFKANYTQCAAFTTNVVPIHSLTAVDHGTVARDCVKP